MIDVLQFLVCVILFRTKKKKQIIRDFFPNIIDTILRKCVVIDDGRKVIQTDPILIHKSIMEKIIQGCSNTNTKHT